MVDSFAVLVTFVAVSPLTASSADTTSRFTEAGISMLIGLFSWINRSRYCPSSIKSNVSPKNSLFIESLVNQNQYTHYYIPHEIIKLPNGNYISLAPDFRNLPVSRKEDIYTGNWSWETGDQFTEEELASFPWMGDLLIEWNPETNEIVWSMSTFDIYDINDYDIFGGNWNEAASGIYPVYDWTHLNAIEYNAEQNAIYISSRHLSKITKIDYTTKNIDWTMGWSQIDIYDIEN